MTPKDGIKKMKVYKIYKITSDFDNNPNIIAADSLMEAIKIYNESFEKNLTRIKVYFSGEVYVDKEVKGEDRITNSEIPF